MNRFILTRWTLERHFSDTTLARQAGAGLRKLLDSPNDLDEARHTCEFGLLASQPPNADQLRIVGQRLLLDAIESLEGRAKR